MTEDTDLRRRTAAKQEAEFGTSDGLSKSKDGESKKAKETKSSSASVGIVDGLRILTALALVSFVASYFVTRGESFIWNAQRPWWTKPKIIKAYFAKPLELTNEELAAYNGSDRAKPILLALNRTIYDVSASPRVYGVGGMYSSLAAKDASRSYITTCFDPVNDLVPYLGGVEEVYVPLWLSKNPTKAELDQIAEGEVMEGMGMSALIDQLQKKIGRRKSRLMREEAYAKGEERVRAQIKIWEGMFTKKEYPIVGRVVGVDETDESKWKNLTFCEAALQQRPPFAESLTEAMKALGSKDGKINLNQMKRSDPNQKLMRDNIPKKSEEEKAQADMNDMLGSGKKGAKANQAKKGADKPKEGKQ